MRIAIVDDRDEARKRQAQVEAAGVEVEEADALAAESCNRTREKLTVRLEVLPTPDLVVVHESVLGSANDRDRRAEDAKTWLQSNTSEQTLVIAYSDGIKCTHAKGRLWRCNTGVVTDHLTPFLETCQELLGAGWPGNVRLEQLTEASWQAIALRHAAALCHALVEGVMGGEGWVAARDDLLWAAWMRLRQALSRLDHLSAGLSQTPAVQALIDSLAGKASDTTQDLAFEALLRELQDHLGESDGGGAECLARDLADALSSCITQ